MVKNKSISAEVHDVYDFQNTLTAPCSFRPRLRVGTPFVILYFQLRVIWMHPWLQTLECYRGMHWLNFSNAADGWLQEEHAWLFGHGWAHVWTNFSFPQAVGKDTVNTCWRDSDFFSNCRAWNTARALKDRFHFFHGALIRRRCRCCICEGHRLYLPAILNPLTPNDLYRGRTAPLTSKASFYIFIKKNRYWIF